MDCNIIPVRSHPRPPILHRPTSVLTQITNLYSIDNALSISSVSSSYDVKKYCIIHTVDNFTPKLTETSPGNWLLEPPQTAISIACSTYVPDKRQVIPRPPTVNFKFTGSGVENYSLAVPVDGTVVPTSKSLELHSFKTGTDNEYRSRSARRLHHYTLH